MSVPQYKKDLISLCLSHRILTFGTFTLKSGRTSPYFFNAGLFNTSSLLRALSTSYAQTIASSFSSSSSPPSSPPSFDILFGPAYKGIPLAASVLLSLGQLDGRFDDVGYAFNRKEAKAHGEGGNIVGAALKGKRVLIIDDVITAGTAIREAVEIIKREGGEVVGIVVALDRGERVASEAEKRGEKEEEDVGERVSTVEMVRREVGVRVEAVLTLEDVIKGLKEGGMVGEEEVKAMETYRARYGA